LCKELHKIIPGINLIQIKKQDSTKTMIAKENSIESSGLVNNLIWKTAIAG